MRRRTDRAAVVAAATAVTATLVFGVGLLPRGSAGEVAPQQWWQLPPAVTLPKVTLRVSTTRDGPVVGGGETRRSTVSIEYVLTNVDAVPVVAFAGIPARETTGRPVPVADGVYVTPTRGGFVLSKRVIAPPEGLDPAAYATLRGVLLAPGESLREHLSVALPPSRRMPYPAAADRRPALVSPVRRVWFCVGAARLDQVYPVAPDPVDGAVPSDGDPAPVFTHSPTNAAAQRVTCSAPEVLPW